MPFDPQVPPPRPAGISDSDRYSRQILFAGIGAHGQRCLGSAHVAIVGCGATGAATASLLARAGVGALTLIDRDFVEPSNLHRQVLFDEPDALDALPKAEAARRHIERFNSSIMVHARIADLVPRNIVELLAPDAGPSGRPGLILDATDNFETRFLINDFAVQQGIPWIYAGAIGAYAATMNVLPKPAPVSAGMAQQAVDRRPGDGAATLLPAPTACLACLFPSAPAGPVDTCDTVGILSSAVHFAASLQATEALKFLTGQPHRMRRTLLAYDLWSGDRSEISNAAPRPGCSVCDARIFDHLAGSQRPQVTLCGRDSVQIHEHFRPIDFAALRTRLSAHADIQNLRANDLLLRFTRGPQTITVFADGRALIQGTTEPALARSLYARFIGS